MKYKLQKNTNGTVTQVINADGGSVYDARPELRKLNQEALERPTPGKLGDLSDTQLFNFSFGDTNWPTNLQLLKKVYNSTVTTGNVTYCVMFGTSDLIDKALYYNITDIKIDCFNTVNNSVQVRPDSFMEFYLLENIETGTTSLGRKIPRRAPLFGADSSPTFSFITDGAQQGYQYVSVPIDSATNPVTSVTGKGLRASGIALKTIFVNGVVSEDWSSVVFNVTVTVDVTSVSSTY